MLIVVKWTGDDCGIKYCIKNASQRGLKCKSHYKLIFHVLEWKWHQIDSEWEMIKTLMNFNSRFQPKEVLNQKVVSELFGLKWVKEHIGKLFGLKYVDLGWAEMELWSNTKTWILMFLYNSRAYFSPNALIICLFQPNFVGFEKFTKNLTEL